MYAYNRAGECPLWNFLLFGRVNLIWIRFERAFKTPSAYVCMYVCGAALLFCPF